MARHLVDLGADAIGVDLSPQMVRVATATHTDLRFLVGDLRALPLSDRMLAGAIALYSLIHFERDDDLRSACREIARVLTPGAEILIAYHRGATVIRPGELFGIPIELAFRILPDPALIDALLGAGLEIRAQLHREPYLGVEHPSRRTYLLARRPNDTAVQQPAPCR